jgi:ribonuclease BN (tRNA processing enzyme)
MKNNNILMKENEDAYGAVFSNSVSKLVSYFSALFQNFSENSNLSEKEQLKIAASEFVDSFIFKELYDDVMQKFKEFYKDEELQIKKKLKENINKFSIDELKLPNSIANCKFSCVNKNLANLALYKTYFEKKKFLSEINEQIIKEADDTYKKATGKELSKSADFMISFWMYILAHSGVDNLISEALFLETLNIQNEKGQDEVIANSFIAAVNTIKNELLRNEKDINVFMVKPFVVTTQE